MLNIDVKTEQDVVVLQLEGELSHNTVSFFRRKREILVLEGYKKFVLDLQNLKFLSSIGVREFLNLIKECGKMNGDLVIANTTDQVNSSLDQVGFYQVCKKADSVDHAIALL